MNKMYEYLKEHAYVSEYKHSNYKFELTKERAECIVNKHNNLIKDLEEENKRLNGAIQTYDILLKSNVEGNRKQQEMIDKIFSRITLWKMEDITKETAKILDELLDILKEVSE